MHESVHGASYQVQDNILTRISRLSIDIDRSGQIRTTLFVSETISGGHFNVTLDNQTLAMGAFAIKSTLEHLHSKQTAMVLLLLLMMIGPLCRPPVPV